MYRRMFRASSILLLLCLVLGALPTLTRAAPSTLHAASASVSSFYPATRDAYDAWNASTSTARPPKTTNFPASVRRIAFYFEYAGAKANKDEYTIVVRNSGGRAVVTHGPYVFQHSGGLHMSPIDAPGGGFGGGAYRADLLVDGAAALSTTFTVGGAARGGSSGGSASNATISIFYPATKAAYDAWNASTSTARPPKTMNFPAGTSVIAFYFEYDHAIAKKTTYTISIHTSNGASLATRGPYTARYSAAYAMRYIPASGGSYPSGTYTAEIQFGGKMVLTTSFSVGGKAVTISIFYPATRAAFDAWNATTSTARPPKTVAFPSGVKRLTFYFEYDGAKARSDQYTIVVRDRTGKSVVAHGPYVFQHSGGLHMSPVDAPGGGFGGGAYRADLLVNGAVSVSTFFTIGATPITQSCQADDRIATCIEPSILRLHANLPNSMEAEGTGFVIRADSTGTYLLTNKHVIDGAIAKNTVAISPDGHTQYQVLAMKANKADEGSAGDLAIVKIQPTNLQPLPWGDSDHLHLLQTVISIGYGDAFDLPGPPTVTQGSISALHRDLQDGFGPVWIQHQSFINHGNSGGPLLDSNYKVVGVNTLSQKGTQGIFFAIPVSMAQPVADQLISAVKG